MANKVIDNFVTPKHFGLIHDGLVGEAGNKICGDTVKISVALEDDVVKDAKFQSFGCIYSFSCGEEVCKMAIGRNKADAINMTEYDVDSSFNGLPDGKIHCAKMAVNALKAALNVEHETKTEIPIKTVRDVRHIVAELFDEFIIPEGASKGIVIHLKEVDPISKSICATMRPESVTFKSFVREILNRIDSFTIYFN